MVILKSGILAMKLLTALATTAVMFAESAFAPDPAALSA